MHLLLLTLSRPSWLEVITNHLKIRRASERSPSTGKQELEELIVILNSPVENSNIYAKRVNNQY